MKNKEMDFFEVSLIGIALSMDAFAVSATCGVNRKKAKIRSLLLVAFTFGFFQAAMPIIGWLMGETAYDYIKDYSKWVAFGILFSVGSKMIWDSISDKPSIITFPMPAKTLIALAIATSLDALAVGVSFACIDSSIFVPSIIIGCITFIISLIGIMLGGKIGDSAEDKFEILGGIVLIGIGLKILFTS